VIEPISDPVRLQLIQIGNLASRALELPLRSLFLAFGKVHSYYRPVDPRTGRPGPTAYIEMERGNADAAIAALNGQEVGGMPLRVTIADTATQEAVGAEFHPSALLPQRASSPTEQV
jgi:RNA recognition motif-containing protein